MDELVGKRVALVTGKGGVGRTAVSAALASLAHRRGKRVLVAEIADEGTDYSPLARHFGRERLESTPQLLEPGIFGVALVARKGQEMFLSSVLKVPALARTALQSEALRRLMLAGPSFREMGVFFQLLSYLRETRPDGTHTHELVIIDMPATGHTLALTGLPDILLKLVSSGPIATALREGQAYLNDPHKSAAYVVTIPEQLPISEALELLEGLSRTSLAAGGVIINRMPAEPFSDAERAAIEPLIARRSVLGAESFRRAEAGRLAVERLAARTRVPLITIPEIEGEGPALHEMMAASLVLARGRVPLGVGESP